MSGMREFIPFSSAAGGSELYAAFVLSRSGAVHDALGGFASGAPDWARVTAAGACVDTRLVDHLVATNRALGVSQSVLAALPGLADGSVRAVVTGQQPGVAGGPLLTLYKIATACALATAVEANTGTRCVPVFWMGADDDDFAEIRDLTAIAQDLSVVSVALDASSYTPGLRVGDIAGDAVRAAIAAVAPFLPDGTKAAQALGAWTETAGDLGEAAARVIVELTAGAVALVDGREPLLRECARATLLEFFDREAEVRALVQGAGARLVEAGFHAQLDLGASSGLFDVTDGVRRKIPAERRVEMRAAFERDIARVSPGVVARNLVQDVIFNPVAVVLGPAEIAYRAQLRPVYDALGVERPVVFPRMSATFLPPPMVALAERVGIGAAVFAQEPTTIADRARARLADESFAAAARAAEEEFRVLVEGFTAAASRRLDVRNRDKLEKRFADLSHRLRQAVDAAVEQDSQSAAARYPFLARAADMFTRAGAPQERFLSMVTPYAFHGPAAWPVLQELAGDSVRGALDGRVGHRVYSL
ncbi:MAG TPA: bacillithiol biosynthesis BshC [Candidatus Krumholzibacteria bacterium]|nr:bacillithiol biosynthesis BshC [Candidatus Krumholzibacteria bacterium]